MKTQLGYILMLCCGLNRFRVGYAVYFQGTELGFAEKANVRHCSGGMRYSVAHRAAPLLSCTHSVAVVATVGKCHNLADPQFPHLGNGHNNASLV